MSTKFTVVNSTPEMVDRLEAIQRASFPILAEDEIITAQHYAAHIRRFPEGQFAVLDETGRPVACSTDFRTTVDFDHFEHRYIDAVDNNWLGNHDPEGDWLYGADIGVQITSPAPGSHFTQRYNYIVGTANINRFHHWRIEYSTNPGGGWNHLLERDYPVGNDKLIMLDASSVPRGLYGLRLTVVDETGNYPEPCEVWFTNSY